MTSKMLIQKKPEETSSTRDLQMGQILCSSGSSKTHESSFRLSLCTMLFLLFLCSGTFVKLVGAISSTELPLNLNVNVEQGAKSSRRGGDELGESERDVFLSSGVTDYSASSESKFTSNGQFAKSTLTAEETTTTHLTPTHKTAELSPLASSSQTTTISTSIIQSPTPIEIPLQSESPVSPIFHINARSKSTPGPQQSPKRENAFNNFSSTSVHFPLTTAESEEGRGKPTNINLLRKLWSSTRSSKLNLTHEHQTLLRIESEKSNSSSSSTSGPHKGSGSGSVGELSPNKESSLASWIPLTPTSISSTTATAGPPLSVQLTSLQPTSLKLGQRDEIAATFTGKKALEESDAPEAPAQGVRQSNKQQPIDFNDGTELSTSSPRNGGGYRDNKFPKPALIPAGVYPEWLSSGGGVYPDDSTNGTGEYYGEPEYENLLNNNENKGDIGVGGGNPGEREEEAPARRMQYKKRINADFLERFANLSGWQNRMRVREQQVMNERENRMAASLAAVSADVNAMSTEGPEAIIAQNGLADVISRGRIDSVVYVYFGDKYNDYHKEEIAGRVIQAVGGVIAAIAQVLTVLGAAKCIRKSTQSNQPPIHLHIGFALLISNLLLLLAVHATEPADVCSTVAMILHYLHLVIAMWLFAHTMRTYLQVRRHVEAPNLISSDSDDHPREVKRHIWTSSIRYCSASWCAPLPFVVMSYMGNPDGYETRHYCWMSIEKGMVISFIVPVFLLIGANTFLVVLTLRHLLAQRKLWADSSSAEMDEDTLDERKISNGIRASAMLLPLLAIMWFLGVVALENASSIFFQIASASANIALSWLVLYFLGDAEWPEMWCCFAKMRQTSSLFPTDEGCHGSSSVQPGAHLSFDNEPLLSASVVPLPSTSSAYGSDVGHSVCKPVTAASTSRQNNGKYKPILPGPSRPGKRQHKSSKRPNWSTPGGSEIYELKMDSISTICT